MEAILECCCGLDVHRDTVVACILKGPLKGKPESMIKTFSAMPDGLKELRQWLESQSCRFAAMESTGVYWQPVYNELETAFDGSMVLLLVNARHMKNVPGRKTDIKDAEWIAQLLRAGLLKGSFIPAKPTRELKELTRYRKSLVEEASAQKNRIEKLLQSAGIKLSSFLSDVFGVSGRNILEYLSLHGEFPAKLLKDFLKGRLKAKEDDVKRALQTKLSPHQQKLLQMQLWYLHQIEENIGMLEAEIESKLRLFSKQLKLIASIPGIDLTAAAAIIGEIGTDLSSFPDAEHFTSWAGLSPGNHESAGKKSPPASPKAIAISKGSFVKLPGSSPECVKLPCPAGIGKSGTGEDHRKP